MKFEHLIEINNPTDPRINSLTRKQLWDGLSLRAKTPRLFFEHLDACDILERTHNFMTRRLRYGSLIIHDKVHFVPHYKIRFDIPAQNEITESSLEITIEEPYENHLFVRFVYQDMTPDDSHQAMFNDYKRLAYYEMDIDMIRIIRRLVMQDTTNKQRKD